MKIISFIPILRNTWTAVFCTADWIRSTAIGVDFFVQCPANWCRRRAKRIARTFEALNLRELYGVKAAELLANKKNYILSIFRSGGGIAVASELRSLADSYALGLAGENGWETVAYRTLSNDRAFCNQDFSLI